MTITKTARQTRLTGPLARMGLDAGLVTAQQRADACGISRSHMLHVERGAVWPSAELLDRMSAAYHIHVDVLERAASLARENLARRMLEQSRGIQ